jgi:TrmH family RNA methyltransferase
MERITSLSNNRIKEAALWSAKARERRKADVYLVEGRKMFLEAPETELQEIFVADSLWERLETEEGAELDAQLKKRLRELDAEGRLPVFLVTDEVLRKIADTQTPQGIVCVLKQKHYTLEQLITKKNPLLVVLEDLQDPGNLGTILRTGEGAGITGVIMSKDTVDLYNPKTIRATMGSVYRVPFVYAEDLKQVLATLKEAGITSYAAHLKGTKYYDSFDFRKGTAFLIGNEGNGLQTETAEQADVYLKIPMEGKLESLNAAVATSILMYEANRQRR